MSIHSPGEGGPAGLRAEQKGISEFGINCIESLLLYQKKRRADEGCLSSKHLLQSLGGSYKLRHRAHCSQKKPCKATDASQRCWGPLLGTSKFSHKNSSTTGQGFVTFPNVPVVGSQALQNLQISGGWAPKSDFLGSSHVRPAGSLDRECLILALWSPKEAGALNRLLKYRTTTQLLIGGELSKQNIHISPGGLRKSYGRPAFGETVVMVHLD